MSEAQTAAPARTADPGLWVDLHGDYLYRYAMFRLRDPALAEDVVQETLLAGLQASDSFAGRGSERTWLVGILKHKIIDLYRRRSREISFDASEDERFARDEFFRTEGEWVGHWEEAYAPNEWHATPAELLERSEFWETLHQCLAPLPPRTAAAFTLREVDGLSSAEICEILQVSTNNLWVMLHRARLHLRHCLEVNWFRKEAVKH